MSEIVVRQATEADLEVMVQLWRGVAELHQSIEPRVWTLAARADDKSRQHFAACLVDQDCLLLVAEDAEKILGFLVAWTKPRPPVLEPPMQGTISDICVIHSARRRGIGTRLVSAALEWFRSEGLTLAVASYATANDLSGPFWKAQGFAPYLVSALRPVAAAAGAGSERFGGDDGYFAGIAETYDRLQPIVAGPWYERGLAMVLDLVPREPKEGFGFVELGCGTATLTKMLLNGFPCAHGLAVDGESAMLEIARQKLVAYGRRAAVEQANILSYRLPECDVVVSSFVFHHLPPEKLPETFRRIASALRPGGCLILLDQMTVGPAWGKRIGRQGWRLVWRHTAEAVAVGLATQEEVDARFALKRRMKEEGKDVEYRHSAEQIIQVMQAAGFDEVGLVWRMLGYTVLMGFVPEGRQA